MNKSMIRYILGWVIIFEALFMLLPLIVGVIYQEESRNAFVVTILLSGIIGGVLVAKKPSNTLFYAREGFVTVSLSWIIISIIGAIPFTLSKEIPNYVDALFETISGFTTTGASILSDVESLSRCCLFWRSFTHWIGGMGVLVFILAVLPFVGGHNMHLMKAESPGPSVGKLVPRVRSTAILLYGMYFVMTVVQIILLLFGKMPLFDALTLSFGTAGTGGFGLKNDSIASYSSYIQTVITVFMILFGINFNVYYFLLKKRPKEALHHEEMRYYLLVIFAAIALITFNVKDLFVNIFEAFRHTAFQVASIITTTGYSTVDFNQWPIFSKAILVILMFIGACAGSTGGGMKVSRIVIVCKAIRAELYHVIHPRYVKTIKVEQKAMDTNSIYSVLIFFAAYIGIIGVSVLLLCLDDFDFVTNFTAVTATINNIGPGLEEVGPISNFGQFHWASKIVLMFDMLAGRLELFPMLVLMVPSTWKKS